MIYVDMEMPKNCYECPMNQGEYTPAEIEKRFCHITRKAFKTSNYKRRPKDCPMTKIQKGEEKCD